MKQKQNIRLLFTGIGSPSTPAVFESISRSSKYLPFIVGADMNRLAGNLYRPEVRSRYILPQATSSLKYVDAVCQLIEKENIEAYFSTCEEEYIWLAQYRERIDKLRCKMVLPPYDSLVLSYDKRKTYDALKQKGYSYPLIATCNNPEDLTADALFDQFDGKLILKVVDQSGARGIYLPNNREECRLHFNYLRESGMDFIAQEFLIGSEWNVTTLHDHEGRIVYAIPRRKIEDRPIKSSTLAATIEDDYDIRLAALEVVDLLDLKPGFNNVEFLKVNKKPYLLEVNGGRIAAQDMNIVAAGINIMDYFFDLALNLPVIPVSDDYPRGLTSLKIRYDIITTTGQLDDLSLPA